MLTHFENEASQSSLSLMRAVIQRVSSSEVKVGGEIVGTIQRGLLVLLGVAPTDGEQELELICKKIISARIFPDEDGKMNLSLQEIGGELLLVSQFTLYADLKKGKRPSFTGAAEPDKAKALYEQLTARLKEELKGKVQTGIFGAKMQVSLVNDGPVTLVLDTKEL
ncbi:MAG: D-aminoacyl-tRNA deacylase [Candidatus Caenarcaniphilales bacterium]|nr:D-aminoacyl-tRNA deacylase [Candidatus Caenarcaniphilales bacterium]